MNGNAVASPSLFIGGEIVLIGLMFHFLPQITRRDLFFAVTIDPAFRNSSDARRVVRQFRMAVWIHSLIAIAMLVVGVVSDVLPLVIFAIVWQIAGEFIAFLRARARVLPHAVSAIPNREAVLVARSAGAAYWLLQLGPFAILAARAAYLRANWEHIPERFAVHWGLDGRPNGWSARSFAGVYGPLLIAGGLCVFLALSSYAIVHWTRNIRSSGDAAVREGRFRSVQLGVITAVSYFIALVFSGLASPLRSNAPEEPHLTLLLAGTFVFVLAIFVVMFSVGQGGGNLARDQGGSAPVSVGPVIGDRTPDRCWKAGMFYFNPNDPALLVEKRFGIGYTINFGHRGAWLIAAAVLAIIIAPLLIARFSVHPR
ncbi:MAG TPA: DUF5808 domain-containing protein [Candidatus Cybelea sp.]|nr:DUF5808 domain-containing protein [Candidatus Cybelea sp.]